MPAGTSGRLIAALGVAAGLQAASAQVDAPPRSSGGMPPALQSVVTDAAHRSGTDPHDVTVARVERRDWSDAGLGCPKPGDLHAQVLIPGWLIEVRSGGKLFEYHTDEARAFVLCVER